jgi:hypothetical protein
VTLEAFDLDACLQQITDIAAGITGIRSAFNYDEWPDAPPGMPNSEQVYHLTALPGEVGAGMREIERGSDLAEYEIDVPLYVVIAPPAMYKRARAWARPFFTRYYDAYRVQLHLGGTVPSGAARIAKPSIVVTKIPFFPGYDDFYTIRHIVTVHAKGAATRALGN